MVPVPVGTNRGNNAKKISSPGRGDIFILSMQSFILQKVHMSPHPGLGFSFYFSPTVGPYRDWHHGLRYVVPNRDWESLRSMSTWVNLTLTFGVLRIPQHSKALRANFARSAKCPMLL